MKIEEAINNLKHGKCIPYKHETLTMAIKALEQEPCEDCISRQEAILQVQRYGVGCFDVEEFSPEQCERFVIYKLNSLQPVTPKEKTGHWITLKDEYGDVVEAVCSCCDNNGNHKWKYCPNCGAKMEANK